MKIQNNLFPVLLTYSQPNISEYCETIRKFIFLKYQSK